MANHNKKGPPVYRLAPFELAQKPPVLIAQQERIRTVAAQSPAFAQVKDALGAWSTETDALGALYAEVEAEAQHLRELRTRLHLAELAFRMGERAYRGAVQMASAGKPEVMQSLGYHAVSGRATPATTLPAPTDLVARPGADPGAVHLSWKAPRGKGTFAVQQSADPAQAGAWSSLPGTSRRTYRAGDLRPGLSLWFRVARVSAGMQSDWTAPVNVTVR